MNVYDKIYKENPDYKGPKDVFDIVMKWLDSLKFSRIIELGCGIGELSYIINKKYPNINYRGYDISSFAIDKCKSRNLGKTFHFQVTDIENHKFEDSKSIFISTQTIEHLSEPEGDIKTIKNIPVGSIFIFSIPLNAPGKEHHHVYKNEKQVKKRFNSILNIEKFKRSKKRLVCFSRRK